MTEVLAACRGVVLSYGHGNTAVHALDDVDLAIEERDSVALLGRSGSGKTTLLHVLGGLVEPSAGTVEWQGRPLATLDAAARGAVRARGIAYVFQGANLLPYFTAFENVAFAVRLGDHDLDPALAPPALLELVGLADKVDHLPSELSGERPSASRSRGRSRSGPSCCSATSRRVTSTPTQATASSSCWRRSSTSTASRSSSRPTTPMSQRGCSAQSSSTTVECSRRKWRCDGVGQAGARRARARAAAYGGPGSRHSPRRLR